MATNFRLAYLNGVEFTDLFPKTSIKQIENATQALKIVTMQVTIPSTTETMQTISISTEPWMENAWVEMYLVGNSEQEELDYATITQYEIKEYQLVITRIDEKPLNDIQVDLVFYKQGVT